MGRRAKTNRNRAWVPSFSTAPSKLMRIRSHRTSRIHCFAAAKLSNIEDWLREGSRRMNAAEKELARKSSW